ncbi:two-component system, chemotaxis family, response regulator CheY [Maridesulfovibrio ferrireducens]|uniref:Two-component system, chemotaxis family, response regulator CheY n=1 Tax=Maridesulfovibrio ferrireducens TaxID=246191 RepID=A0A1G9HT29_9BACT|nr:two-component system, chemotaxis family, response regulator CheY [Maridesulfovibrio ferrireducens]
MIRILVVEDELASRKFLSHMMESYGQCDSAINGIEAVTMFEESIIKGEKYDLICMDIMMPEMDGQEALKKIREIENKHSILPKDESRVIMTTALSDPKTVIEAYYKGGATHYLVKPITLEKLNSIMSEIGLGV